MFGTWDSPGSGAFGFAFAAFVLSGRSVWFTWAAHRREQRRELGYQHFPANQRGAFPRLRSGRVGRALLAWVFKRDNANDEAALKELLEPRGT
jgi:hypothetical protein